MVFFAAPVRGIFLDIPRPRRYNEARRGKTGKPELSVVKKRI